MIVTRAPYRILDCGGWTDTAFMPGGEGLCCNVAVTLYMQATYTCMENGYLRVIQEGEPEEIIQLPYHDPPKTIAAAAAAALDLSKWQGGVIKIHSDAPSRSGLGGSGSYSVAFLAALKPQLLKQKHDLAALAQSLETQWLGRSCGTQDQMAASFGGVSYSEVHYPQFTHEAPAITETFRHKLESGLILVYTGQSHSSSHMHQQVMQAIQEKKDIVTTALVHLKECAKAAAEAMRQGDYKEYQRVVNDNWDSQKNLHPSVTTAEIESLHAVAKTVDPNLVFKGSGAGAGGSVALLVHPEKKASLVTNIKATFPAMLVWDNLKIDQSGACVVNHVSDSEHKGARF